MMPSATDNTQGDEGLLVVREVIQLQGGELRSCRPQPPPKCVKYRYVNMEERGIEASIAMHNGQVNFTSSVSGDSQWHGSYRYMDYDSLEINFNCKGAGHQLHTTSLMRTHYGWHGHDYLHREIFMAKLCEHVWDRASQTWVVLE